MSLRQFRVYTRRAGESALRLVESGDLSTRTLLSGVDPYANLTIGVSLVNSAGLESRIELIHFVGSKHPNTAITTTVLVLLRLLLLLMLMLLLLSVYWSKVVYRDWGGFNFIRFCLGIP